MRATTGSLSCSFRYSASDSSASIDIANRPGWSSRGLNVVRPASKKSARFPLASSSHTSVRLPRCAASSPSAAAMVVLPTPPLPLMNSSFRSSRSTGAKALDGAEPDSATLGVAVDLEVGDLGGGHADAAALLVGQPEDLVVAGDRGFDVGDDLIVIGLFAHVDLDLLRR